MDTSRHRMARSKPVESRAERMFTLDEASSAAVQEEERGRDAIPLGSTAIVQTLAAIRSPDMTRDIRPASSRA